MIFSHFWKSPRTERERERERWKWFAYIHAYQTWIMINRFCAPAKLRAGIAWSIFSMSNSSAADCNSPLLSERFSWCTAHTLSVPFRRGGPFGLFKNWKRPKNSKFNSSQIMHDFQPISAARKARRTLQSKQILHQKRNFKYSRKALPKFKALF